MWETLPLWLAVYIGLIVANVLNSPTLRYAGDNGPTAKKFFGYKYRKYVLDLFPTATPRG